MFHNRFATMMLLLPLAAGGWPRDGRADDPPPVLMSEMQPPTEQDWIDLARRRTARQTGGFDCRKPILLYGEIIYYPCPVAMPCGEPLHRSYQGTYGMRHPDPYFIPAIHVGVPDVRPLCATDERPFPHRSLYSAGPAAGRRQNTVNPHDRSDPSVLPTGNREIVAE